MYIRLVKGRAAKDNFANRMRQEYDRVLREVVEANTKSIPPASGNNQANDTSVMAEEASLHNKGSIDTTTAQTGAGPRGLHVDKKDYGVPVILKDDVDG